MITTINVLFVLLGALVAAVTAFGDTHDPGETGALRRLNARGWTVVLSVGLALIIGVTKEFLPDEDKNAQRQLLMQILASGEADRKLPTAILEGGTVSHAGSPSATKPLLDERRALIQQREQLIQEAQRELYGIGNTRQTGAGPRYRFLRQQIDEVEAKIEQLNKQLTKPA